MRRLPILPVPVAIVAICLSHVASADRHVGWHQRIQRGPKMDITAATFFGGEGSEEFVGVTVTPSDKVLVCGNSWGPPFSTNVEAEVLGTDGLWDVPLYPSKKEEFDEKGRRLPPPEKNPNRTGFMVFYSGDLQKIERIVRFGWGVASITAAEQMSDNSIVFAGLATQAFAPIVAAARTSNRFPRGTAGTYGQIEYEKNIQPGDCFVGALAPDARGFDWIWVLDAHRIPPTRIMEGPGGDVYFDCQTMRRISADRATLTELFKQLPGRQRTLGVSPVSGLVLVGGSLDDPKGTGREPWQRPVLRLYTPEGKSCGGFFDWEGWLAGHDALRLVANSEVRAGCFLANGEVLACVWSDGPDTVATRNPIDLTRRPPENGVGVDLSKAPRAPATHLVRFDPADPRNATYAPWVACTQGRTGSRDGRVAICGRSEPFLVQTTTRWYGGADHYRWDPDYRADGGGIRVTKKGWPDYDGRGGREDFSTVFAPGFTQVLWSSAIALCEHTGVRDTGSRVVFVSRCTGASKEDGRSPLFMDHDVAPWVDFIIALRTRATLAGPSPARRVWENYLSAGLRKALLAVTPDTKEVSVDVQKRLFFELNKLLAEFVNFYDEESWKECAFTPYEQELIAAVKAKTIGKKELMDLNRRLIEKGFPEHVFRCPKSNRPPTLNAVQPAFGGGFYDGHIYILEPVRPESAR